MTVSLRNDVRRNATLDAKLNIQFAEITRVRYDGFRFSNAEFHELPEHRLDQTSVNWTLTEFRTNDKHGIGVHRGLRVVALDEAFSAGHDARFRVGEVQLCFGTNAFLGTFRRTAVHLLAVYRFNALAIGEHLAVFGLLLSLSLCLTRFYAFLGLGNCFEPIFAPRKLRRNIRVGNDRLVDAIRFLGKFEHSLDLISQLRFETISTFEAQRAVLGGIRLDLGSIQTHAPNLQALEFFGEQQDLIEHFLEMWQEPTPKRGNRIMVGMLIGRDITEGHRVVRCNLDLPARSDARGVSVKQKGHEHFGMIRRRATAFIRLSYHPKVQLRNQLHDEPCQMLLRKPVLNTRRHQKQRVTIVRNEVVRHA